MSYLEMAKAALARQQAPKDTGSPSAPPPAIPEALRLPAPAPETPRPSFRSWVDLDRRAVRDALGTDPAEHDLTMLRFDVVGAVRQIEAEIATGIIGPRPLLVRGRPLGEWLNLDDVARLLRLWRERPHA